MSCNFSPLLFPAYLQTASHWCERLNHGCLMQECLGLFRSWICKAIETVSFTSTTTTKRIQIFKRKKKKKLSKKHFWLIRACHIIVYCNYKCWGQHKIPNLRKLWVALFYRHIYYSSTRVEKNSTHLWVVSVSLRRVFRSNVASWWGFMHPPVIYAGATQAADVARSHAAEWGSRLNTCWSRWKTWVSTKHTNNNVINYKYVMRCDWN